LSTTNATTSSENNDVGGREEEKEKEEQNKNVETRVATPGHTDKKTHSAERLNKKG
jgi:hypothetical protein